MVGLILCLGWDCVHLVWKGERPRLRQDGPRDAHSPRLSFLEAKALKRTSTSATAKAKLTAHTL